MIRGIASGLCFLAALFVVMNSVSVGAVVPFVGLLTVSVVLAGPALTELRR